MMARKKYSSYYTKLVLILILAVSVGLASNIVRRSGPKIIDLTHWWDQKTLFPPTNIKNFTMNTYFRKTATGVISFHESSYDPHPLTRSPTKGILLNPVVFLTYINLLLGAGNSFSCHYCPTSYQSETIELGTDGGTHMVSPAFLLKGRATAARLPLDRLFLPMAVVDVSHHVVRDPNYQLRIVDVKRWEDMHGKLPQGGLLMVNTGWSKRFWGDASKYFGTDKNYRKGKSMNYPGIHPEAAQWLVSQRRLFAVGIDTPAVDHGLSRKYESQQILLSANVYLINNVDHVWALPPAGATAFVFPMKIKQAAVVPIRLMALSP